MSGDDGMSNPPEAVRLTGVLSATVASGGDFEAFDLGGVDAEDSGVEWYVSLGGVSSDPCIAQVMVGSNGVIGMQQLSAVV